VPVGVDPKNFIRDEKYTNNSFNLGKNAIYTINNFLSTDICKYLVLETNKIKKENNGLFWDDSIYSNKIIADTILNIIPDIKDRVEKLYKIKVKPKIDPHVMKWETDTSMDIHVDDLSYKTSKNHISTIIYLNKGYKGGEIFFSQQNLSVSPKVGDLLIFPGNLNYPHEVKKITTGARYTLPTWFKYV
jgi:hypothetical protein